MKNKKYLILIFVLALFSNVFFSYNFCFSDSFSEVNENTLRASEIYSYLSKNLDVELKNGYSLNNENLDLFYFVKGKNEGFEYRNFSTLSYLALTEYNLNNLKNQNNLNLSLSNLAKKSLLIECLGGNVEEIYDLEQKESFNLLEELYSGSYSNLTAKDVLWSCLALCVNGKIDKATINLEKLDGLECDGVESVALNLIALKLTNQETKLSSAKEKLLGFYSDGYFGQDSLSQSMSILALSLLDENVEKFVVGEKEVNLVDNLYKFRNKDKGFKKLLSDKDSNLKCSIYAYLCYSHLSLKSVANGIFNASVTKTLPDFSKFENQFSDFVLSQTNSSIELNEYYTYSYLLENLVVENKNDKLSKLESKKINIDGYIANMTASQTAIDEFYMSNKSLNDKSYKTCVKLIKDLESSHTEYDLNGMNSTTKNSYYNLLKLKQEYENYLNTRNVIVTVCVIFGVLVLYIALRKSNLLQKVFNNKR